MNVELVKKDGSLKILFEKKIHVFILVDEFIGFQSWIGDNERFYIEFYTKTQDFYTEYSSEELWSNILTLLDKNL